MWLLIAGATVTGICLLKMYHKWTINTCNSKADLTGKTVLITGANQGIGYWTALDLATRNARVILACRSVQRGEAAVRRIKEETGSQNVVLKIVDMSDLTSVRKLADQINTEEKKLHILINNAGIPSKFTRHASKDGNELTMSTNYFGPFLLTNLLLGVTSNSLEPGAVNTSFHEHYSQPLKLIIKSISAVFFKNAEEGSRTIIYCAVSEDIQGVSGRYFSNCSLGKESKTARDDKLARKLWDATEKIVDLAK